MLCKYGMWMVCGSNKKRKGKKERKKIKSKRKRKKKKEKRKKKKEKRKKKKEKKENGKRKKEKGKRKKEKIGHSCRCSGLPATLPADRPYTLRALLRPTLASKG